MNSSDNGGGPLPAVFWKRFLIGWVIALPIFLATQDFVFDRLPPVVVLMASIGGVVLGGLGLLTWRGIRGQGR